MSNAHNLKKLPKTPGIYIFRDAKKAVLYIGKAVNLKRRVSSYFHLQPLASQQQGEDIIVGENNPERVPLRRDDEGLPSTIPRRLLVSHDSRIEEMVGKIARIQYRKTDSALEALMLEAKLIKKHQPRYNILQKDDKTFLYVEFTKEKFPRLLLARGKELQTKSDKNQFGPFLYAGAIREALRILRKIFPWSLHDPENTGNMKRPCFDYQVGLCPGTCVGIEDKKEYAKTIRKLKLFFQGKKKQIIRELEKEMKSASKHLEFEGASAIKRQIFSLKHIQDIALINASPRRHSDPALAGEESRRIEGYDISNISGTSAVGSMVVFEVGAPNKNEYRKFKISGIKGQDDTGMIREVLDRRLKHREWPLPELILIDGGKGQVGAARLALAEQGLKIPVVGIAKGPERKKNEFLGEVPEWTDEDTLIRVRDEAHRFAIAYHKHLRGKQFKKPTLRTS